MSGPLTVLVVRFGALGDVVLTTPLLRALQRTHPGTRVTLVTKSAWAPLFEDHPHVTAVESLSPTMSVRMLARRLRATTWDHRLDLHGSLRSHILRRLVGGRWGAWRKPRLRRALRVWGGVDGGRIPPVAEQYFAAARGLGITPDGGPPEIHPPPAAVAQAAAVAPPMRFAALAAGAAHATKRWPVVHWNRLARRLADAGVPTVALGTWDDPAPIGVTVDARGIGLGPTAALLGRAAVAVTHDSGLMHLATAVGIPVVALFGPTDPALGYGPYEAEATVVRHDLPCRPCSVYGGAHCPLRHHRCMIDLMPDTVAAAVQGRLA